MCYSWCRNKEVSKKDSVNHGVIASLSAQEIKDPVHQELIRQSNVSESRAKHIKSPISKGIMHQDPVYFQAL